MPHSSCRLSFSACSGALRFIIVTDSPDTASINSASWRRRSLYSMLGVAIGDSKQQGIITETYAGSKEGQRLSLLVLNQKRVFGGAVYLKTLNSSPLAHRDIRCAH